LLGEENKIPSYQNDEGGKHAGGELCKKFNLLISSDKNLTWTV
jgi:hypothetical protein